MWRNGQNLNMPRRDKSGKRWNFRVWHHVSERRDIQRVFYWDDTREFCGVVFISPATTLHRLRQLIDNLALDPGLRGKHRRELQFPLARHYSEYGVFPEEQSN
jgi:hypothetical protein